MEATIQQIKIGGWVMYPLVILSLWMWFLIIKKFKDLRAIRQGELDTQEAIALIGTEDFAAAPWQREIVGAFLEERTSSQKVNDTILEGLELSQEDHVTQFVGTISLLATIAPLLGLLGTVGGMIKTFEVIAEFGTGNARALASGISEALITTQTGLVIAVPGMFAASQLVGRTNDLLDKIGRFRMGLSRSDVAPIP